MAKKRKRQAQYEYNEYGEYYSEQQPVEQDAYAYSTRSELPWDIEPYWKHRHSMFSLYDEGVWTTNNSWFEVTHESVANMIAQHVAEAKPDNRPVVIDCFAGIGGNAIAFALSGAFKRVYAVEKDAATLECARHNAEIYGVHDKITWFQADCFELLGVDEDLDKAKEINVVRQLVSSHGIIFASPPWGGPGYKDSGDVFNLNEMQPYSMDYMYEKFAKVTQNMVLYLPRTSDLQQISDCVASGQKAQIVHYCLQDNSKALCAYLGEWKLINTKKEVYY